MIRLQPILFVILFCLAGYTTPIRATQYLTNLEDPPPYSPAIGAIQTVIPGHTLYGVFTTGTSAPGTSAFELNFITLENVSSSLSIAATLQLQLLQKVGSQFISVGQLGNPVANPTATQWPG